MRRILLLLLTCGCCSCMSVDVPSKTEAGWVLFGYAEEVLAVNRDIVERAVQFDEYLRQTTDEGRREVHDRYFPRERIVNDGNVWQVISTWSSWTCEIQYGSSLKKVGTAWQISWEELGQVGYSAQLFTMDSGILSLKSEADLMRFRTKTWMECIGQIDEKGAMVLAFLRGKAKMEGKQTPQLDMDVFVMEPFSFVDGLGVPYPGGRLEITAHNQADNADEEVVGTYLEPVGEVEITYRGVTETWNRVSSSLRE